MSEQDNDKREPAFDRYSPEGNYVHDIPSASMEPDEDGAWVMWDDIQAKIAKGELMVVKTARLVRTGDAFPDYMYVKCDNCHTEYVSGEGGDRMPEVGQFCLCGAKITP